MASALALYNDGASVASPPRPSHPTAYLTPAVGVTGHESMHELIAAAESLALLDRDWDGEHSPRIEPNAIHRARWFLENLTVPWLPVVSANRVGGVRVEWDADTAYLIIDFEGSGDVQVLYGAPDSEPVVWRNDEIPEELEICFAEVNRVRQGQ